MPYHMEWLYKDRIAFISLSGVINIEDIPHYVATIQQFLDESTEETVHFVEDMTQIEKINVSLIQAGKFAKDVLANEKLGWVVAYGSQSKSVDVLVSLLTQLMRYHVRTVSNFEDALKLLKKQDMSLPDLAHLKALLNPKT